MHQNLVTEYMKTKLSPVWILLISGKMLMYNF
jgi:hypothetical protein